MTSTSDAVPTISTEPPHSRAGGRSRSRLRQTVKGVLSAVLVAAIFYFLFRKIDFAEVWTEIRSLTWLELGTLFILAVYFFPGGLAALGRRTSSLRTALSRPS